MNMKRSLISVAVLGAMAGGQNAYAAMCASGYAAPFCVTDTVTWSGSGASVSDLNPVNTPVLAVTPTVSYTLGDQFNLASPLTDFPSPSVAWEGPANPVENRGTGSWNFYDNYVFSLTGANVRAAAISFTDGMVGVGNLEARIIQIANPAANYTNTLYDAVAAGDLGNPPGSGSTVVDAWTAVSSSDGVFTVNLNKNPFGTGAYVLQLRGELGTSGSGSYGGSISFTPVPLPAALPLLLSGVGLLGGALRRNSAAPKV